MYKPKKVSFQTSVSCANSIKMKTHFQFILMNWNITLPKMVRNNILEEKAMQEKYPGYASRNSFLKFVRCMAADQNNNNIENSDSSHFSVLIHPNCKN